MQQINTFIDKYLATVHIPKTFVWTDIVEIIIISFLVYQILAGIRNTRTWARRDPAAGAEAGAGTIGTKEHIQQSFAF